ncbi:MFS transporter [Halobacillus halophilus]|uniref:MFS transporter n=1 Tax=Halobacillus halophilus TaxID=1570 RepID=UPI001CD354AC|nr:MFS transporter [Halobacillus halophilus]MCA1011693.1 MFS transporter [Halobacillus halophilus]
MIKKMCIYKWKNPLLLLTGVGISRLGYFIYLVAINLLVLKMTGSATAIAGLWAISPLAVILTQFWSGSIVDRSNKRHLMIGMDIIRAGAVGVIPLLPNVWIIYFMLFLIGVAKAFFNPTSMTFTTQLVPKYQRKRFNSINSLITSGAFIVGPSIAGILIMIGSVDFAIYINAFSFLVSAFFLYLLPNVDSEVELNKGKLSIKQMQEDWKEVIDYGKQETFIISVYVLYLVTTVCTLAMDSQEVVFTQQVVGVSEFQFSLLVTITGIGFVSGSLLIAAVSKYISIKNLIGIGFLLVSVGYGIYAFSHTFVMLVIGFIILGFFNAFSSTGILTFYQNNIPVERMGRITSVLGVLQSIAQIAFILFIGLLGEWSLRYTIIGMAAFLFITSIVIVLLVYKRSKQKYFLEDVSGI